MKDGNPTGIAGWLWLIVGFQINYLLQHLRQAVAFAGRETAWTPYAVGEIVGIVALPLYVLLCLALLFQKSRRFPRLFLVQIWLIAGANILGVVLASAKLRAPQELSIERGLAVLNIALAILGTLYILRSRRVRNTFVT